MTIFQTFCLLLMTGMMLLCRASQGFVIHSSPFEQQRPPCRYYRMHCSSPLGAQATSSDTPASGSSSFVNKNKELRRPPPKQNYYDVEYYQRRIKSNPAIELLDSALSEGVRPEDGLFTSALKECRYSGDATRALYFLSQMQKLQMRMREIDFIATIVACGAQSRVEEAIDVFERMKELGVRPGANTYVAIITACSRGGKPQLALSYFRQMGSTTSKDGGQSPPPPPNAACYVAMMETFRRHGQPTEALSLLDEMMSRGIPTSSLTLTATIRALSDAGDPGEALRRFDEAVRRKDDDHEVIMKIDTGCYAAALDALAELGEWRSAIAMINEMDEEGEHLRVGRQHYNAALRACAKAGEWGPALALLDGMRRRGMKPDEKCHRWALIACSKGCQWQLALDVLDRPGIEWTMASYQAVMRALVQAGEPARGLALWQKIVTNKGLSPNASMGDMALSLAGKEKDWKIAESIYLTMMQYALEPHIAGLGVIIEGRCQQGRVDEALALLQNIRSPNVVLYTSVISALGKQGDLKRALALLCEMEEKSRIAPDQVALTAVLDACLKAGALKDAEVIARRLKQVGGWSLSAAEHSSNDVAAAEDAKSFVVQLRALLERGLWGEAVQMVDDVEEKVGEVPSMCYSILLHAAGRQGRWEEAIELLMRMRDGNKPLSYMDVSSAINASRNAGEWELSLQLLEVMQQSRSDGMRPNTITYGLVLKALSE